MNAVEVYSTMKSIRDYFSELVWIKPNTQNNQKLQNECDKVLDSYYTRSAYCKFVTALDATQSPDDTCILYYEVPIVLNTRNPSISSMTVFYDIISTHITPNYLPGGGQKLNNEDDTFLIYSSPYNYDVSIIVRADRIGKWAADLEGDEDENFLSWFDNLWENNSYFESDYLSEAEEKFFLFAWEGEFRNDVINSLSELFGIESSIIDEYDTKTGVLLNWLYEANSSSNYPLWEVISEDSISFSSDDFVSQYEVPDEIKVAIMEMMVMGATNVI